MERKIVYLINPISGTSHKSSLKEVISRATEREKIAFEIVPTQADGDYSFLREKINNEKITDVVVCGGDGSISAVSSALIGMNLNIGIIPMGSGNGLALCAGIPKKVNKALKIIFKGKASYIDGFYVNGEFSCMLAGVGFDAQVAHEFAKKKKRGLRTYIKISIRIFLKARPYHFDIITKEEKITTKAFFISVANSNQFGNNFKIAPKASLNDGLLDVVVVKKMNKLIFPFNVFRHIYGFRKKRILYFQADELTIINHDRAPLHVDGEPKKAEERLDIRVEKNAIRLIHG